MLLAADIGNTQTALGLFEDRLLRADWRIATRKDATADETAALIAAVLAGSGFDAVVGNEPSPRSMISGLSSQ